MYVSRKKSRSTCQYESFLMWVDTFDRQCVENPLNLVFLRHHFLLQETWLPKQNVKCTQGIVVSKTVSKFKKARSGINYSLKKKRELFLIEETWRFFERKNAVALVVARPGLFALFLAWSSWKYSLPSSYSSAILILNRHVCGLKITSTLQHVWGGKDQSSANILLQQIQKFTVLILGL